MFFYIYFQIPSWRRLLPSSAQYHLLLLEKINGILALVRPPIHESYVANTVFSRGGGTLRAKVICQGTQIHLLLCIPLSIKQIQKLLIDECQSVLIKKPHHHFVFLRRRKKNHRFAVNNCTIPIFSYFNIQHNFHELEAIIKRSVN